MTMQKAYELAAAAVRQRYAEQRPEALAALDALRKADVAVYTGTFDHVHEVLTRLGVPFTLDPKAFKLEQRVVFVNCASSVEEERVRRLEAHVREGATLVTSDWALTHLVQKAFPGTVEWTGRATGNEVVGVEPAKDSLWGEIVVLGADPQWWLESSSHPIRIVDEARVRVEAASHELLDKQQAAAVAVAFPWGRGRVFHVISHFWLTATRAPGPRHRGPAIDFLAEGMRLSGEGIGRVLRTAGDGAEDVGFAALQSAATSTELVAALCCR
jgi:hypothetical protein